MLTWVAKRFFGTANERAIKKMQPRIVAINALEEKIKKLSDAELKAKTAEFKEKLDNGATLDDILVEAFAVCREAGQRVLKMRHYDVQLIGGMVLHNGAIAEMRTGEGKTLVATLPCYLNALEGKGVHVVTVNDYLATRDAEWMGQLYSFLGLTTGTSSTTRPTPRSSRAYQSDITLRPEQRVRLRLPARQHEVLGARVRAARRSTTPSSTRSTPSSSTRRARRSSSAARARPSSDKYRTHQRGHPAPPQGRALRRRREGHSVTLTDDGVELVAEAHRHRATSTIPSTSSRSTS